MRPTAMWIHESKLSGRLGGMILAGVLVMALGSGPGLASAAAGDDSTDANGGAPLNILFIHHSCGGQLLAPAGENQGKHCIYDSHPNGGGLRDLLTNEGFAVNEASYGSTVARDTDICHWNKKFAEQMDLILVTKLQDETLPAGQSNQIVAFKSCYPNNGFKSEGQEPGDPDSCELTVANAKAAYSAVLDDFARQPDVLFIAFTAPPMAEPSGFKYKLKTLFKGKPKSPDLARQFNTWLADPDGGWLAGYETGNVVVFDYYDILTKHGQTNWSAFPTGDGTDSHPSKTGNSLAAEAFVSFIKQALAARAGSR